MQALVVILWGTGGCIGREEVLRPETQKPLAGYLFLQVLKAIPSVGNVSDIPELLPWEGYDALCKQYGDIVYLEAIGQGLLILGSSRRAVDLLETRATNYSDRPDVALIELTGQGWNFGMMPYGPQWRQHRRVFHDQLKPSAVSQFYPIMYEETNMFLRKLKSKPKAFLDHIHFVHVGLVGTTIMRATYGIEDPEKNAEFVHYSEMLVQEVGEAGKPGRYLVNVFPILKYIPAWFPGAGFQHYFREIAEMSLKTLEIPPTHPSMTTNYLDRFRGESNASEMLSVARNTTASGKGFFLVMANNPDLQKKAQAELDAVEVSRWYIAVPLGVAHCTTEDDEYDGYFIPKNTFILANAWAMMHNEEMFDKPFEFNPERFLKDGNIDPSIPDAEHAAFGFGRRICPGRHFAGDALFILTASILATFNIDQPKDKAGNRVSISLETTLLLLTRSKLLPFECDITPRLQTENLPPLLGFLARRTRTMRA
ncbi:cytochrome P450 [Ephemerocybe angulata]|uniref:Cytochrome P450 n=1 Tax=Ephemerocybe angulata TaxID=980116 RepID=A0A8H6M368_9AGAR|nr:cytochrome P450 [Tulosesus angulatus]